MSIDRKISHYSLNNPASIYDEEALTALELAGRTAGLVNECVDNYNALEKNTSIHLTEQDNYIDTMNNVTMPNKVVAEMKKNINNGTFDTAINKYIGNLNERVDNLLNNTPEGSTTMDAELLDIRVDSMGVTHNDAGTSVRNQINNVKDISVPLAINNLLNGALSIHNGRYYDNTGEFIHSTYKYYTLRLPAGDYISTITPRYIVDVTNNISWGDGTTAPPETFTINSEATVKITYKQTEEPLLYNTETPFHEVEKIGGKIMDENVKLPYKVNAITNLFGSNNLFNNAEKYVGYYDKDVNTYVQVTSNYTVFKIWLEAGSYTIHPRSRFIVNKTDNTQIGSATETASIEPITIDVTSRSLYYISMFAGDDAKLYTSSLDASEVDPLGTLHLDNNVVCGSSATNDVLYGKKYVACGDSFTEGGNNDNITEGKYKGYKQAYPYYIGNRTNMEVVNLAVNGMTMCNIDGVRDNAFSNEHFKNIPLDADYITLKFGINDHNFNSPLGSINDTDTSTFYGAWNTVMEYIITNIPFAKVGIIVTNGTSRTELTDATRKIARKWGVPILDEAGDYNVPLLNRVHEKTEICTEAINARTNAYRVSETDGHPNGKAHEYESTFIEAFLRRL